MRTQYSPVPVGGWNASMPVDLMPPTDAAQMINFIPKETSIQFRQGSLSINLGSYLTAPVETLVTHRAGDGSEQLIGAAGGRIFSVNTSTGVETQIGSGYTNDRWQTVNFNDFLLLVNGADAPQQYDGTTLGNYASAISAAGLTATDVVGITVFKGRCYYWENNAAKIWYAAAGAYGGTVIGFPLDLVTKKGGYVVECMTWTRDSGSGVDDLFAIIMSTGETLVYQGSDPSSWALIGVFNLGEPLTVRGSTNLASDRIILTKDGFVNLSTALQVGRASEKGNVSTKIIEDAKKAAQLWGDNYGWEVFYHDKQSLLMVNIPRQIAADQDENAYEQYCMNTNTGAWTRFTGWNGITFTEVGGELYMGCSDGGIKKCFVNSSDDDIAIDYVLTPGFNSFGMPERNKQLTYITVLTNFETKDNIGLAGLADYEIRAFGNAAIPDLSFGQSATWDLADWDEDYWDSSDPDTRNINKHDIPVQAYGYSLSCKLKIKSNSQTSDIYSFRYKYKLGRSI